ncbi:MULTISPECIES: glycosyltransferase family 2 protein [unclassified Lentimicrobium]|uniref:glycosyltransferase family 2 protein n=1 Tax=unclassified Lentimicrobium TaxID=2677434 RepID=UPI001555B8C8|nr:MULTISPECIES: glycosyltransferase family 2 protein [unclassified Lentimicrobium]NPD45556.1 glycosyltransferase family 2 protein [Lentimicrobium sp. S6]NPD83635.1 glycosyltransferase family 2 protein [Lentimicrobium sp. L6]
MISTPEINIIIPLYNEEDSFKKLIKRIDDLIENSEFRIEVILVDDGSRDATTRMMEELSFKNSTYQSIFLSRNFGHQMALTAGLESVNATKGVMIIDGDLQDPPEMLDAFYAEYKKGNDVVYAIREERKGALLLRIAYQWFYKIMKRFAYIHIPLDSGDFSFLSRRVVDEINKLPEEGRFLRGIRAWVGFKQIGIPYHREERKNGDSKYSLKNLTSLAMNGIFNFSKYPIRFTMVLGTSAFTISMIYFIITLFRKIFIGDVPSGFTALLFVIILFGGLQLMAIGVIGEYILRIFFQVKNRPHYIVQQRIKNKEVTSE